MNQVNDLAEISALVGYRLRELRIAAGYSSYEQFAFDFKISRIQYWKMENGNNFTLKSLLRVLDAHDLKIEDFIESIKKHTPSNTEHAKRLSQIIEYTQLTKKEFCQNLGYKNLTAINHVLIAGKLLTHGLLNRINKTYPEVNVKWLKSGEGSMLYASKKQ